MNRTKWGARELLARLAHDDSRHLLAYSCIERQHALGLVAWFWVVDLDRERKFVEGGTHLATGRLELRCGEFSVGTQLGERVVAVEFVFGPRPLATGLW